MLIHVTHNARWARTLSRWYRLETPRRIDTSQVFPEVFLSSYCPTIGFDGIGVPLQVARIVMAQRPAELACLAFANGFDKSATIAALPFRHPRGTASENFFDFRFTTKGGRKVCISVKPERIAKTYIYKGPTSG